MPRFLCLLIVSLVLTSTASAQQINAADNRDEVLAMLEKIKQGYLENQAKISNLRITGRVTMEQKSAPGKTAPEKAIRPLTTREFGMDISGSQKRFESHDSETPDVKTYLLDGKDQFLYFEMPARVRILRNDNISKKETNWARMTGVYSQFSDMTGNEGGENVAGSMALWIKDILDNKMDGGEKGTLSITTRSDGILEIVQSFVNKDAGSIVRNVYQIDPKKGYNIVNIKRDRESNDAPFDIENRYEYSQTANGAWVISAGSISMLYGTDVSEPNVLLNYQLVIDSIETENLSFPDNHFEASSLDIPAEAHTSDYRFSPPLEWGRDIGPGALDISKMPVGPLALDNTPPASDVVTVGVEGGQLAEPVVVATTSGEQSAGESDVWKYMVIAVILLLLVIVLIVYKQSRRTA